MRGPVTLLLAAAIAAGACKGKGKGPTCHDAGARFLVLARADLDATKDLDPANRRGVLGMLAPMRDAMIRACKEDGWSAEARACFVGAPDVAAFRACDQQLTGPQRELMRKAASKGIQPTP